MTLLAVSVLQWLLQLQFRAVCVFPDCMASRSHTASANPPQPSTVPRPINEANDVVFGRHHRQMAFRDRVAGPNNEINLVLIGFEPAAQQRSRGSG